MAGDHMESDRQSAGVGDHCHWAGKFLRSIPTAIRISISAGRPEAVRMSQFHGWGRRRWFVDGVLAGVPRQIALPAVAAGAVAVGWAFGDCRQPGAGHMSSLASHKETI